MIKVNKIKCTHCKEIIESKFTHDFQTCSCGKVSVDGGKDYLKRSAMLREDFTELAEYEEEKERV
jgi:hypothetical protein